MLQEAPVVDRRQSGLLDAAAAAVWIERQRTLHDPSRATGARVRSGGGSGRSAAPMSRRQRLNRRRQQAAAAAGTAGARSPRPWNDPLTGVLLCPEALEHIVVHSSIVPDSSTDAAGPSTASVQTSK